MAGSNLVGEYGQGKVRAKAQKNSARMVDTDLFRFYLSLLQSCKSGG